jgi:hypothetical protein
LTRLGVPHAVGSALMFLGTVLTMIGIGIGWTVR